MFGWFRKRDRDEARPIEAAPAQSAQAPQALPQQPAPAAGHEPGRPETERESHELAPAAPRIVVGAPSLRPAMPLSDRPNIAGRAVDEAGLPRLLDPSAALSEEARDELTALLADMFGARGRYRLEWRADREPGDDAMFSEIMVADLVRRIQNTIADVAELERPAERPALEAAPAAEEELGEEERQRAIESFLTDADEDGELAALAAPAVDEPAADLRQTA